MEQPFRCPKCRAEFSTREQLEQHMRQHGAQTTGGSNVGEGRTPGQGPADLLCPRCGVEFSNREELDRHMRAQHRAE